MKILLTGNMGYVGSVVVKYLRTKYPAAMLIGYDTAYFGGCLLDRLAVPERHLDKQIYSDVRRFCSSVLTDVDAVVLLSAISNDPMGEAFVACTDAINRRMSLDIACKAKKAGVGALVFASSCSVYGAGGDEVKREDSGLSPLTAYARSKIEVEKGLRELAGPKFKVTCLRFATACGLSPRLRLDLVLNDFVASAVATGRIDILSDGESWRPLIDVKDMARAIDWAIRRQTSSGGDYSVINVGSRSWNYRVRELAEAVASVIPGVTIAINSKAAPDRRSYKVDFSLFETLAPDHQPIQNIENTVRELYNGLKQVNFKDKRFRESFLIRLFVLRKLRESGMLTEDLFWTGD